MREEEERRLKRKKREKRREQKKREVQPNIVRMILMCCKSIKQQAINLTNEGFMNFGD